MRRRTTRHGRTERNRHPNAQVGWRGVALAYVAILFVPVALWVVENPMLAASIAVIIGVVDVLARISILVVGDRLRARRAA